MVEPHGGMSSAGTGTLAERCTGLSDAVAAQRSRFDSAAAQSGTFDRSAARRTRAVIAGRIAPICARVTANCDGLLLEQASAFSQSSSAAERVGWRTGP
jgi:hypothetical protein